MKFLTSGNPDQGVFRALKTLKALKTLNSENLTLKIPKTLKRPVFLGKTLKMTIIQFQEIMDQSERIELLFMFDAHGLSNWYVRLSHLELLSFC